MFLLSVQIYFCPFLLGCFSNYIVERILFFKMYFWCKSFVRYTYCKCFLSVCGLPFHFPTGLLTKNISFKFKWSSVYLLKLMLFVFNERIFSYHLSCCWVLSVYKQEVVIEAKELKMILGHECLLYAWLCAKAFSCVINLHSNPLEYFF